MDLKFVDPGDPMPEVVEGEADLAIVVSPKEQPADGIRLVHLLDDPYHAVLPKGHHLASKRVVDLAELADEPWVNNELSGGPCQERC